MVRINKQKPLKSKKSKSSHKFLLRNIAKESKVIVLKVMVRAFL